MLGLNNDDVCGACGAVRKVGTIHQCADVISSMYLGTNARCTICGSRHSPGERCTWNVRGAADAGYSIFADQKCAACGQSYSLAAVHVCDPTVSVALSSRDCWLSEPRCPTCDETYRPGTVHKCQINLRVGIAPGLFNTDPRLSSVLRETTDAYMVSSAPTSIGIGSGGLAEAAWSRSATDPSWGEVATCSLTKHDPLTNSYMSRRFADTIATDRVISGMGIDAEALFASTTPRLLDASVLTWGANVLAAALGRPNPVFSIDVVSLETYGAFSDQVAGRLTGLEQSIGELSGFRLDACARITSVDVRLKKLETRVDDQDITLTEFMELLDAYKQLSNKERKVAPRLLRALATKVVVEAVTFGLLGLS